MRFLARVPPWVKMRFWRFLGFFGAGTALEPSLFPLMTADEVEDEVEDVNRIDSDGFAVFDASVFGGELGRS